MIKSILYFLLHKILSMIEYFTIYKAFKYSKIKRTRIQYIKKRTCTFQKTHMCVCVCVYNKILTCLFNVFFLQISTWDVHPLVSFNPVSLIPVSHPAAAFSDFPSAVTRITRRLPRKIPRRKSRRFMRD